MGVSFRETEPFVPETAPAASRLVPPRYPPAPPGTAGAGDSDDYRVGVSLLTALETLCRNIEVVRNALVELEQVPQEEAFGLTCRMIVEEARPTLAMHVRNLRDRIQPGTRRFFTTDLDAMRRELARSSARGLARATLDEALGVDVFQSVARTAALEQGQLPSPQYQFPLPANPLFIRIALLPSGEFLRLVLEHLITEVEKPEHYQSLHAFDLYVSQQFLALWYVAWQATTPESSGGPGVRMGRFGLDPSESDPEEERLRFWRR
jgi:hypothetical protein